jgi:hypothetical protein
MSFDNLHVLAIAATMMLDTRMSTRVATRDASARVKNMRYRQQSTSAIAAQQQPQQLLGMIVSKEFQDTSGRYAMYQGQIVSVSCVKDGEPAYDFGGGVTATIKYEVAYDDGDSEDMTYSEVLGYIV